MAHQHIKLFDPEIYQTIIWEQQRQQNSIELIASENYQSNSVLEAQSSHFANKYSEWFPGKRYYGGQTFTDQMESIAIERAKKLFRADHANVQALSGAAANVCIYAGLLEPGDTILWMDLSYGWHLTHWAPVTFISKIFNFVWYKTLKNWNIDYQEIEKLADIHKPKMILAGFSAYPRNIDFAKFKKIWDKTWAILFADMSHIGWFIASGILENPLDFGFHVMMTTTHKSLRGPRWAIILSKWVVSNPLKKPEDTIENIPTRIDRAVFPGVQWWPHMNTISAIAIALKEASTVEFKEYAKQTLQNAKTMAESFIELWYKLTTGWTDNHMIIVDFSETEFDWKEVENLLDKIGISTSKSTIPDDHRPPFRPSGVRIWAPAMTTRWAKEKDFRQIVEFIDQAIKNRNNIDELEKLKKQVAEFSQQFPVPWL